MNTGTNKKAPEARPGPSADDTARLPRRRGDIKQLERSLLGAAVLHVDEAVLLRRAIQVEDFTVPEHRRIAAVVYRLADSGLLENPADNVLIVWKALQDAKIPISWQTLTELTTEAACPGTHFRRIGAAWRDAIERERSARALEEQAEALRRGVSHE